METNTVIFLPERSHYVKIEYVQGSNKLVGIFTNLSVDEAKERFRAYHNIPEGIEFSIVEDAAIDWFAVNVAGNLKTSKVNP